jgi:hypothetical protein
MHFQARDGSEVWLWPFSFTNGKLPCASLVLLACFGLGESVFASWFVIHFFPTAKAAPELGLLIVRLRASDTGLEEFIYTSFPL